MVLGIGGIWEMIRSRGGTLLNGISALIKGTVESPPTPLQVKTLRKCPSMNQEVGSHQTLNLLVP